MYDFLVDEIKAKPDVVNAEGFSPLTLAAATNNARLFAHVRRPHACCFTHAGLTRALKDATRCLTVQLL